jgi:hypothetical protein
MVSNSRKSMSTVVDGQVCRVHVLVSFFPWAISAGNGHQPSRQGRAYSALTRVLNQPTLRLSMIYICRYSYQDTRTPDASSTSYQELGRY